ncbi:MAG: divalent-cation tolerance protein CutA [Luteolibacter sp.]
MLVFCTFPDVEKAREAGSAMVSGGYAACVNLVPSVESIYVWEGEIKSENEVLAIFKVGVEGYKLLETQLLEIHPYDTPEIVGVSADRVEGKYLDWVLRKAD